MGKRLVLVGGGHAHLTSLLKMGDLTAAGHAVTLISPSPRHPYSGMGPGMLGGFYSPAEIEFPVREMTEERGGVFIEDRVVTIDAPRRLLGLASGREIPYDVVSFNVGSGVPKTFGEAGQPGVFPVKPVANLCAARERILELLGRRAVQILVVGGGPAGLEIAGNAWKLLKDHTGRGRVVLVAGERLLNGHAPRARREALVSFTRRSIEVIEGRHVIKIEESHGLLDDGSRLPFDVCLVATGVSPPDLFETSGLPVGRDGGLLVNGHLQSVAHPEIFGGGDCVSFAPRPLDKVGVYAVRQNPVLHRNLLASLEGRPLETFLPQKTYLLIFNLGDGQGLLSRGVFVWRGRSAFLLKDFIDRSFMRKFLGPFIH